MLHSGSLLPNTTDPTPLIAAIQNPGVQNYSSVFAAFIIIQSRTGNSDTVRVTGQTGGNPEIAGIVLAAGEKVTLPWCGAPHSYDLSQTYVITNGSTDVVDFVYGSV